MQESSATQALRALLEATPCPSIWLKSGPSPRPRT